MAVINVDIRLVGGDKAAGQLRGSRTELERLTGATSLNRKSLQQLGDSLSSLGSKVSGLGANLTALTAPLGLAAAGAVKTFSDFEVSLLQIENLVGRSKAEVLEYRDAILALAPTVGKGPRELADALFAVTSAGAEGARALEILESSAKASAIGLGDTRTIALAVTAATTAYGEENLSAANAVETLVNTVKFGNLQAEELAGTLGQVTPIASQLGVTFQDVGAFIATFTRLGGDASEATTALRGFLSQIASPGEQAAKALAQAGLSADQLRQSIRERGLSQTLVDLVERFDGNTEALGMVIPNVRALTGVLATAGSQGESFIAIAEDMAGKTATLEDGFSNLEGTTSFTFAQFAARAEAAAIKFGGALAPSLLKILDSAQPVLDVVVKLAEGFAALPQPVQTAAVAMGGVVLVGGPILIFFGQVISGVGNLIAVVTKVGPAMAAVSGAVGSTAASLSSVLLPALAVVATAIAAFTLTDFILEWTGLRESLDGAAKSLLGVKDVLPPTQQQTNAMAQASQLAGREITSWDEATRILNDNINVLRGETVAASVETNKLADEERRAADAAREQSAALRAMELEQRRKEAEAFALAVGNMAERLGGAGVQKEADLATAAIQRLGGNLSVTGIQSLAGLIDQLRTNSMQLSPELQKVALELDKIALQRNLPAVINEMRAAELTTADWNIALGGVSDTMGEISGTGIPGIGAGGAVVGGLERKTFDWNGAMNTANDILSETRGAMTLLGIDGDSAFGKILGGISKVFDALNSLTGLASKLGGVFGKLFGGGPGGGGAGGVGGLLSGGGLLGKLGGLFGGGGVAAGAVPIGVPGAVTGTTGAVAGGGLGGLGGALGGLLTNPITGIVAGGIVGGLLLKKLFGREGNAETTAEFVGIEFDKLSKDLQQRLQKVGEEVGDFATGLQLNLGEIIAGGGIRGGDAIAEKIADTFSFLDRGDITKGQAGSILGDAVPQLLGQIDQLGEQGVFQLERLLAAADRTGVGFSGISELAQGYVMRAQELGVSVNNVVLEALGLNNALALLGPTSEASAAIATAGLTSLTDATAGAADKMAGDLRTAGLETSQLIQQVFGEANANVQDGVSQIAATFSQVSASADGSVASVKRIATAAMEAARAARDISFPGAGAGLIPDVSAARGMNATLSRDTLIQAHAGERAIIIPREKSRRMDFRSAQGGMGSLPINMGNTFVSIAGGASRGADGKTMVTVSLDELIQTLRDVGGEKAAQLKKALGVR